MLEKQKNGWPAQTIRSGLKVALLLSLCVVVACLQGSVGDDDDSTDFEGDEPGECGDGADNDRDGLYDCDDPDCAGAPGCNGNADDDDTADDDDSSDDDDDDDADDDDDTQGDSEALCLQLDSSECVLCMGQLYPQGAYLYWTSVAQYFYCGGACGESCDEFCQLEPPAQPPGLQGWDVSPACLQCVSTLNDTREGSSDAKMFYNACWADPLCEEFYEQAYQCNL